MFPIDRCIPVHPPCGSQPSHRIRQYDRAEIQPLYSTQHVVEVPFRRSPPVVGPPVAPPFVPRPQPARARAQTPRRILLPAGLCDIDRSPISAVEHYLGFRFRHV